jgi:hypothetical protein
MTTRRSLLASTAALAGTTLAGCLGADGPERHYVDVLNYDDAAHTFRVVVIDDSNVTLFEREYDLDAGTGDENRIVEGAPATIRVSVDDDDPVLFPWQPPAGSEASDCSSATASSLTINYDLQIDSGIDTTFDCETVRTE